MNQRAIDTFLRACGVTPQPSWPRMLLSLIFVNPPQKPAALFPHIDFTHPHLADVVRIPLQLLWLILVRPRRAPPAHARPSVAHRYRVRAVRLAHQLWQRAAPIRLRMARLLTPNLRHAQKTLTKMATSHEFWDRSFIRYSAYGASVLMAFLCVTTPFGTLSQLVFVLLLLATALLIRRIPGSTVTLLLTVLSVTASSRYLWWRISATLNWDETFDLMWGALLLTAEIYTYFFLVMSYIQTSWPLYRKPLAMPANTTLWPMVDVFIPTYNEPLKVVRSTVFAAMGMDWPQDKLRIHLLDDGRREEFRYFAENLGVNYITRLNNDFAKAGNLNHALAHTAGEYIAIFDCDHIPTRSFLQVNMGWFLEDPKLALVQTPHHFYSADPFERNLDTFKKIPNEGELFYGLIQDGNDLWNAAFFCGSCAILRRTALEAVGGIGVETVTEDSHTALKLHRKGYNSAYINIPQAAGLATESLSAHIGQRIRWARGMAQIFRLDNPFFGKGLNWAQRVCYSNAMLSFFSGIPRLMFLTSPLAFLLFHAYVIYAPAISVVLYVLPHMVHATIVNSRTQGKYRHSFWAEVYETVLSWYIARPTLVALINPRKGKFNVTAKGGLIEKDFFDWTIATPFIILILLNATGLVAAAIRLFWGPQDEVPTVIINLVWTLYNCLILGGTLFLASEVKQIRLSHRVRIKLRAILHLPDGKLIPCETEDISEGGVALRTSVSTLPAIEPNQHLQVSLWRGNEELIFSGLAVFSSTSQLRLRWQFENETDAMNLIQCTFGRADAWVSWAENTQHDKPLESLKEVVSMGITGYRRVIEQFFPKFTPVFRQLARLREGIVWYLPRTPTQSLEHRA